MKSSGKGTLAFLVAGVIVAGLTLTWLNTAKEPLEDQINAEYAKLESLGIPTTPEDLARESSVPPESNAAPGLLAASAACSEALGSRRVPRGFETSIDPADWEKAREILSNAEGCLALAETAVQPPRLAFDQDWTSGFDFRPTGISEIHWLAQLLTDRAILLGQKGDFEGAIKDLQVVRQIANRVAQDPTRLSAMVAESMARGTVRAAGVVAGAAYDQGRTLAPMAELVAQSEPVADPIRVISHAAVLSRALPREDLAKWSDLSNVEPSVNFWDDLLTTISRKKREAEWNDPKTKQRVQRDVVRQLRVEAELARREMGQVERIQAINEQLAQLDANEKSRFYADQFSVGILHRLQVGLASVRAGAIIGIGILSSTPKGKAFPDEESLQEWNHRLKKDGITLSYRRRHDGFAIFAEGATNFLPGPAFVYPATAYNDARREWAESQQAK